MYHDRWSARSREERPTLPNANIQLPCAHASASGQRARAEEAARRKKIEIRVAADRAIKEYLESIISNVDPDALEDVIVDPNNAVDPYTAENYDFLKAVTDYYEICNDPLYAGQKFSMLTKMEKVYEFLVLEFGPAPGPGNHARYGLLGLVRAD